MPRWSSDGKTLTLVEASIGQDCRDERTGEIIWAKVEELGIKRQMDVVVYDKNLQSNENRNAAGVQLDQSSIDAMRMEMEAKLRAQMKEEMADQIALAVAAAMKAAGSGAEPKRAADIKKRRGRPKGVPTDKTPAPPA